MPGGRADRGQAGAALVAIDLLAQVAGGGAAVKPVKLLIHAEKPNVASTLARPSNIDPSNMPERAARKRRKTAIPEIRAQLEQLRLVDLDRGAQAEADRRGRRRPIPKVSPRTPCIGPLIRPLRPKARISDPYFIPLGREAISRQVQRPARLFPCSQCRTGSGTARERASR